MRKILPLLLLGSLISVFSYSQDFSNKGKDFYLCFPQHVPSGTLATLSIWITSDQASSGTITTTNGAFSSIFNIPAYGLAEIQIPFAAAHISNAESSNENITQISKKSIHVKVNAGSPDIVAYVQEFGNARSAASLLLPTNVLGKKYFVQSFTQNGSNSNVGGQQYNARSQFQVIATKDNTVVQITPMKNGVTGTTFTVNLPLAGDMIQYQSRDPSAATQDLTGTYIESVASGSGGCLPIAVFSGSSNLTIGSQNPACNGGSYDPLFQQLYPVSTWGKSFGLVPFANYPRGVPYRVLASEDNTTVYFDGVAVATLNHGQIYPSAFVSTPPTVTLPTYITADKPISVAEYMQAAACSGNAGMNNQGDPDMVILNPIEQNIKDITIFSTKQQVIQTQWVNVLIPTAGVSSFLIAKNGGALLPPTAAWQIFPTLPGYSYLKQQLDVPGAGTNPVSDSYRLVSDSGFNAIAYGLGDFESYAYSAGTNVKDLYQQVSVASQYGIETSPSVCTGSPFKFRISLPYQPLQLDWILSNLPSPPPNVTQVPTASCTSPGAYPTYVCYDSTTFVNGKQIWWYSLPSYYMVNTVGNYDININATTAGSDGCGSLQNIDFNLEVSNPPVSGFTYNQPGCVADTVHFTDATTSTKPEYHWYWNFGDPGSGANNTSALQNPVHVFSAPGNHIVRFASITTPGCLSDTLAKTINVPAQPAATISGTTAVCQNAATPNITLSATGGTAPFVFTYHINAGALQTVFSGGSSTTISVPTGSVGTFTYTLDSVRNATGSQLCDSRVTGQTATVIVNPLPTATIAGTTTVCQNSAGPQILFTAANGTRPYTFYYTLNGTAQTPVVTGGGSNSATITAPTGAAGSFQYVLTSVKDGSSTACTAPASGTATVTVNPLPTATVAGTSEVCMNASSPHVIFTAAGGTAPYNITYTLNGVSHTATTTGNQLDIAAPTGVAGTFVYALVTVQESSSVICAQAQSGSATIIVDPLPTASFTINAPDCATKDVTFTPSYSVASGAVVSWVWDYGDGTGSHTRPNGNPFIVNYATPGAKTVTFKTISDKGCQSAVFSQVITINPKPQAGFIAPQICLLDPYAQFTDTSHVAAPGVINAWQWNFGDANATPGNPNTSTAQNPRHIYTQVGPYTVQLIVTTSAGCSDTISHGIYISDGNPQANYNIINPAGLCSNDSVGLINKSTILSGNITKLTIYWDYVNQPTVFDSVVDPAFNQIFKHKYPTLTTAATYTIHVRAYSGGVCYSFKDTTITVHAAPVAQLSAIPDICLNNGTVQFTQGSESAGVPGTGSYSGAGVSSSGLFNPISAGAGVHPITYTFTSSFGCVDSKTVNVKVLAAPVASFAPVLPNCQNTAISFTENSTATAGTIVKWVWHWGDGSADQTYTSGGTRTHLYTITGTVTATLTVTTDYGCLSTPNSVTFTVNPQPLPNFNFTSVACLPQAKIDFVNSTPNLTDLAYQWNFDDLNASGSNPNSSVAQNPSHVYSSMGPHLVKLTATSGTTQCTHDTTIAVNSIHPAPTASFSLSKPTLCIDQTELVTDHSNPADGTMTAWLWNFGDNSGNAGGRLQPPHVYHDAGNYVISLKVTNSFGCTDDTTRPVIVYPYPTVDAGPDRVVLQGAGIQLQASASGNQLTFLWTPPTFLNNRSILQPVTTPTADITYKLTVTAQGGCAASDSVFVEVLKVPDIPNTFTPNNDGVHDTWEIKYLNQYPDCRVQVFTRTGELVFESHGYGTPWNGTKNGKPLPFDTYYFIIEPGSGRQPFTGYVTILK